ncbi:MAG: hypothetical protein Q3974_09530, partial [Rothia sp. (in: high G+C Gram-positive bacteria)]|nr:hypothetical protein [Rothia sp. (in: high G+C Gram-positive bacteria)]
LSPSLEQVIHYATSNRRANRKLPTEAVLGQKSGALCHKIYPKVISVTDKDTSQSRYFHHKPPHKKFFELFQKRRQNSAVGALLS